MKTTFITLLFVIAFGTASIAEIKSSCSEKDMNAIKTNFDESYKKYKNFFDTLYCYERKALAGDEKSISSIVGLYGVGSDNAEYTEWYAEAIVKIFLKQPNKLLNLLLVQKNKEVVDGVIYRIKNPITDDDKAIAAVVKKVIKDPKYKTLAKQLTAKSVKQGHIQDK